MIFHFILISLSLILYSNISLAQFNWRFTSEAGQFYSGQNISNKDGDFLARFDADLNYKIEGTKSDLYFGLKVRPELYGFDDQVKIFRIRGNSRYSSEEKDFVWGINTVVQKQFYWGNDFDFDNDIFFLSGDLQLLLFDGYPLDIISGYAYQTFSAERKSEIDLLFAEAGSSFVLLPSVNLFYNIYAETFSIEGKSGLFNSANILRNKGWRHGIKVSLKHIHHFTAGVDYRFLFHNSELTIQPSFEHWIRLFAGKMITQDLSIFALADFYFRKFTLSKKISDADLLFLYLPLNLENKFYIKTSYSAKENLELFIKSGYFKEDLFSAKYSLSTWYISAGIEISK
jgi:hypothetical protein